MTDNQNTFYTSISKHYSEIFPYKPVQLQFVKKNMGNLRDKYILDIGCATGELAFHLAQEGAEVTGIDLNEDLLRQAKAQKQNPNLHFQTGDMLNLEQDFSQNQFDSVLCFGNTLVHLPDKNSVLQMLQGTKRTLKPGGCFFLQILNYDYILKEHITELPLIETPNVKFVRKYKIEKGEGHVKFITDLYLKNEGRTISNETTLLALQSGELVDLLQKAGFQNIQLFANFKMEKLGGNHLPLVLSAEN